MPFILDPQRQAAAPNAADDLVKDSDTQRFVTDVIDASREVPVIVDFWAPWCGPCKTLGPILERLVRSGGGIVRLVKINVDENQNLAAQLRVQSIPAVYAFRDGRAVDGFIGAQPESNVRSFIERLTKGAKPPVEAALEEAWSMLEAGEVGDAAAFFNEILQQIPGEPRAAAGLLRCHLAKGDLKRARKLVETLPAETLRHADVEGALAALKLAEQAGTVKDEKGLRARLASNPDDHQTRYDLANALFAHGNAEAALDELLEIVRRDRAWNDDAARKQLISIFEALGPRSPLTQQGRRRLSSILFS